MAAGFDAAQRLGGLFEAICGSGTVSATEKKHLRAEAVRAVAVATVERGGSVVCDEGAVQVAARSRRGDWILSDYESIMRRAKQAAGRRVTAGQVRRALLEVAAVELAACFSRLSTARRVAAHPAELAADVGEALREFDWAEFLDHDVDSEQGHDFEGEGCPAPRHSTRGQQSADELDSGTGIAELRASMELLAGKVELLTCKVQRLEYAAEPDGLDIWLADGPVFDVASLPQVVGEVVVQSESGEGTPHAEAALVLEGMPSAVLRMGSGADAAAGQVHVMYDVADMPAGVSKTTEEDEEDYGRESAVIESEVQPSKTDEHIAWLGARCSALEDYVVVLEAQTCYLQRLCLQVSGLPSDGTPRVTGLLAGKLRTELSDEHNSRQQVSGLPSDFIQRVSGLPAGEQGADDIINERDGNTIQIKEEEAGIDTKTANNEHSKEGIQGPGEEGELFDTEETFIEQHGKRGEPFGTDPPARQDKEEEVQKKGNKVVQNADLGHKAARRRGVGSGSGGVCEGGRGSSWASPSCGLGVGLRADFTGASGSRSEVDGLQKLDKYAVFNEDFEATWQDIFSWHRGGGLA
jgi:hypothetical protein